MRARVVAVVVTAASVCTALAASAAPGGGGVGGITVPATGATPTPVVLPVRVASYPVFDAAGRRAGVARWRESTAGGNCCEISINATPQGQLVESGGTYPWVSADEGRHWSQVRFVVPDQNDNGAAVAGGEGAVVVGPGGDVFGVTWDAYSGDHLQAYRYRAAQRQWSVSEVVVKSPFYDRPWLTYVPGAGTLPGVAGTASVTGGAAGQRLDVTGGGLTKDLDTLSLDGLTYLQPSAPVLDTAVAAPVADRIRVVPNPAADYWQPAAGAHTLPLTAGGVLRLGTSGDDLTGSGGCPVARLTGSSQWQCVTLPGSLTGVVRQDSRGALVSVTPTADLHGLLLATSLDGGVRWRSTLLRPPAGTGALLETPDLYTVVANGRLGEAVVSARFDDAAHHGHDLVFRVSTRAPTPRLLRTYAVGQGDLRTGNDVTSLTVPRFDYASVALLPDDRIAVSFDDSTTVQPTVRDPQHRSPEVAVLL